MDVMITIVIFTAFITGSIGGSNPEGLCSHGHCGISSVVDTDDEASMLQVKLDMETGEPQAHDVVPLKSGNYSHKAKHQVNHTEKMMIHAARPQAKVEPQLKTVELNFLKLSSIMQRLTARHNTLFASSLAHTSGRFMAGFCCCVLAPVLFLIIVILSSPSTSRSKDDSQPQFEMRWYHFFVFVSVSMLGPMSTDIILPAFPQMARSLGCSYYWVSLTMPVNMGVRGVSMVVIGLLSDRFGQKKMMVVSLLLFVGGSIICSNAKDIATMLLGRIVQGLGEASDALVQAVVRILITDPTRRMGVLSVLTGLQPVFVIIAPFVGSVLTAFLGWRSIYCFLIIAALGSLLGYAALIPETVDDSPKQPALQQFAAVFGNQEALFLLCPFALTFSVLLSMLNNIPFVLESFGVSTIGKGLLIASMPPFVAVGATITNFFFAREGQNLFITLRRAMFCQCLLLVVMFCIGMTFVDSEWLIMGSFWSITFGVGMVVPILATLFLEPLTDTCGLAAGLLVGAQNISAALLLPIGSSSLDDHGIQAMFIVFMTIHLIGHGVFWLGFCINHKKWLPKDEPFEGKPTTKQPPYAAACADWICKSARPGGASG
mmetsp:Transcript_107687/g.195957  ORF Transcript_107687/g.195957 Transcript_107687/m.195957 type:complete len:601 (+) Transcript_107687:62-1864(+)